MEEYQLHVVDGAHFSDDRTEFSLTMLTDRGSIGVRFTANQIDHLMAAVEAVETIASVHDPVAGPLVGESVFRRPMEIESAEVEIGAVNGRVVLLVGFQKGPIRRWFSMSQPQAVALRDDISAAIPQLGKGEPPKQ